MPALFLTIGRFGIYLLSMLLGATVTTAFNKYRDRRRERIRVENENRRKLNSKSGDR